MFSYRCYTCSTKLGDGLPPIEAMSTSQREVIDGQKEIWHDVLNGTKFEGMSSYSFCGFCLALIKACPEAYEGEGPRGAIYGYVYARKERYFEENPEEAKEVYPFTPDYWKEGNRKGRLAWAKHVHPNRDYTMCEDILTVEEDNR